MAYSSALEALLHPWSGRIDRLLDFPPLQPLSMQTKPWSNPSIEVKRSLPYSPQDSSDDLDDGILSTTCRAKLEDEAIPRLVGENKQCGCVGPQDDSLAAAAVEEKRQKTNKIVSTNQVAHEKHGPCSMRGTEETTAHPARLTPMLKRTPDIAYKNDYFNIDRSKIAGWGAFASKDLELGDVILKEIPLFMANLSSLYQEYNKLDQLGKEIAMSLHASGGKLETPHIKRVWDTNCFTLGIGDFAGLFPIAARFNHACNPANNIDFRFDRKRGHLRMAVRVDKITAGDELTISYGVGRSPLQLYEWYGFQCRCGACKGLSDEEVKRLDEAEWETTTIHSW